MLLKMVLKFLIYLYGIFDANHVVLSFKLAVIIFQVGNEPCFFIHLDTSFQYFAKVSKSVNFKIDNKDIT